MKADRPLEPIPAMRDCRPTTDGDEITQCFQKLTLKSVSEKTKNTYNIQVDETKTKEDTTHEGQKKDIKVETKDNSKKTQEAITKSTPKKGDAKENEKPKAKEEELGELCARGPQPKSKWATQNRASTLPYSLNNVALTNGGQCIFNSQYPQLGSEDYSSSSVIQTAELSQEFNFTQQGSLASNDINQFSNIHETCNQLDFLQCPDIEQLTPLSPTKPETQNEADEALEEKLRELMRDPSELEKVVIDLLNSPSKLDEVENLHESQIHPSPYSYGNLSPTNTSSPQVVPKSQFSPYSISSGSPLGPSSPNLYANTPTASPNMPSPRGYPSDDSNHMYAPNPNCNSMFYTQFPRPHSSCSSTSSTTNQSFNDQDPLDSVIYCEPSEEGRRRELRVLEQELDSTCSEAVSQTEAQIMPQNLPVNSVPLASSPIIITTIITGQSPTMIAPISNGTNPSTPRLRRILPKTNENNITQQQSETFLAQNVATRQHVNHNKTAQSQRKSIVTAKDQLLERCTEEKIKNNWAKVQSLSDEDIAKIDKDGDTALMILVCSEKITSKPEQLYALVERCKSLPHVLCARNNGQHNALCMAGAKVSHDPLVAMYIAEAMIEVNADLDTVDHQGFSVIHLLCEEGDQCAKVLNQLLSLRNSRGKPCFDINKSDYEGRSPLHLAVQTHYRKNGPCLEIVKVLLKNGADVLNMEAKQGSNPLHFALATSKADLNLIKMLCNNTKLKDELVNAPNFKRDTPLHVAMAFAGSIERQTHNCILNFLMECGALRSIRNQNGKVPLEMAPELHKVEIKKILDKYNVK